MLHTAVRLSAREICRGGTFHVKLMKPSYLCPLFVLQELLGYLVLFMRARTREKLGGDS